MSVANASHHIDDTDFMRNALIANGPLSDHAFALHVVFVKAGR